MADRDILEVLREAARVYARDVGPDHSSRYLMAANEIERLRGILKQFADNQLSDDNCASVEVAAKRIRGLARAALQGRD